MIKFIDVGKRNRKCYGGCNQDIKPGIKHFSFSIKNGRWIKDVHLCAFCLNKITGKLLNN